MSAIFRMIPPNQLQRGRYQPRICFDAKSLEELAESIRQQGLIEPLIVREVARDCFEIIAGERRWRAAMQANLSEIPCLVGEYSDEQAATLTLVENIQREELTLIEEAQGYRRLCDEFHFHQQEIAVLVSKSRSHVANLLRLLSLSALVQDFIQAGQLSLGHARLLVGLDTDKQVLFAQQAIAKGWSVRHLEEQVKLLKKQTPPTSTQANVDIARLEGLLSEQVGAPVQILSDKDSSGWLQFKFFDNDTLAGLLERMRLRYD